MGARYRTVFDNLPAEKRTVESLKGKKVKVGVLNGEHQWLASIHEYGCKIPVTNKMRAYLHHIGIHLKQSTTVITIPERSFIRAGHDTYQKEVLDKAGKVLGDVLDGTMDADTYCRMVGELMASKVKKYAIDLKDPPNSGWTVTQKGSSNPLIDTGDMVGGITYEVEG